MHHPKDQLLLDNRTEQEKLDRTTPERLAKRGSLIKQYKFRYLAKNEYPHIDRGEQMVLRLFDGGKRRKTNEPYPKARREFVKILGEHYGRSFANHLPRERSVSRYHIHIFK